MLHYDPQHVSSSTLLILRRTNCITTASGIVTLCKQPYSMPVFYILFQRQFSRKCELVLPLSILGSVIFPPGYLRLLPPLFIPSTFTLITCFDGSLYTRCTQSSFVVCRIFLSSLTPNNTSYLTRSIAWSLNQLSFSTVCFVRYHKK